jgi:hypothetical protein
MDGLLWKWLWRVAVLVGVVAGITTIAANHQHLGAPLMYLLVGACLVLGLIGVVLDFKPWRWSIFQRDPRKAALLEFRETNDPAYNLTLPSSRRTTAARPAETKASYRAARELAIKKGLKPPKPTGNDEYDASMFWQWAGWREPDDV